MVLHRKRTSVGLVGMSTKGQADIGPAHLPDLLR
jgi:hypothetical protein